MSKFCLFMIFMCITIVYILRLERHAGPEQVLNGGGEAIINMETEKQSSIEKSAHSNATLSGINTVLSLVKLLKLMICNSILFTHFSNC